MHHDQFTLHTAISLAKDDIMKSIDIGVERSAIAAETLWIAIAYDVAEMKLSNETLSSRVAGVPREVGCLSRNRWRSETS